MLFLLQDTTTQYAHTFPTPELFELREKNMLTVHFLNKIPVLSPIIKLCIVMLTM